MPHYLSVAVAVCAMIGGLAILLLLRIRAQDALATVLLGNSSLRALAFVLSEAVVQPRSFLSTSLANGVATATALVLACGIGWVVYRRARWTSADECASRRHMGGLAVSLFVWVLGYLFTTDLSLLKLGTIERDHFPWQSATRAYSISPQGASVIKLVPGRPAMALGKRAQLLVVVPSRVPCWSVLAVLNTGARLKLEDVCLPTVTTVGTSVTDLRQAGRSEWKFRLGYMGMGLFATNTRTGEDLCFSVRSLFVDRGMSHLTILPGDQLVLGVGTEIIALDWNTRRVAVLGRGESPVAVFGVGCGEACGL